jgi:hypothetical protein
MIDIYYHKYEEYFCVANKVFIMADDYIMCEKCSKTTGVKDACPTFGLLNSGNDTYNLYIHTYFRNKKLERILK